MADEYRRKIRERMNDQEVPLSEVLHASVPYDQYLTSAQHAYAERDAEDFIENMREVLEHEREIQSVTGIDLSEAIELHKESLEAAEYVAEISLKEKIRKKWSEAISKLWQGDSKFWEAIDESKIKVEIKRP